MKRQAELACNCAKILQTAPGLGHRIRAFAEGKPNPVDAVTRTVECRSRYGDDPRLVRHAFDELPRRFASEPLVPGHGIVRAFRPDGVEAALLQDAQKEVAALRIRGE